MYLEIMVYSHVNTLRISTYFDELNCGCYEGICLEGTHVTPNITNVLIRVEIWKVF